MLSDLEQRFEAFVAEHGRYLRAVLQKGFPRGVGLEVDDLVQEAGLRLWQSFRREKTIEHPASYVYRIAISVTIDAIRRRRARPEVSAEPAIDEGEGSDAENRLENHPDPSPSPEQRAEWAQHLARVEQVLDRIGADRAQAVRLHLQGLGFEEVAMLTGWSSARARNLIYRGLADLRAALDPGGGS